MTISINGYNIIIIYSDRPIMSVPFSQQYYSPLCSPSHSRTTLSPSHPLLGRNSSPPPFPRSSDRKGRSITRGEHVGPNKLHRSLFFSTATFTIHICYYERRRTRVCMCGRVMCESPPKRAACTQ